MLDHRQKHYGLLALLFASYADTVTRALTKQPSTSLKLVLFNRRVTKDMFHRVLKHFVEKYEMPPVLHPCDHLLSRSLCTSCAAMDGLASDIFKLSKTACRSAMLALHKATECGADADELLKWAINVNITAVDLVTEQLQRPTFGSTCSIYDALCDWQCDTGCSRFGFACCVVQLTLGLPCPIAVQPFETLCAKDVKEVQDITLAWFRTVADKLNVKSAWPLLLREEACYEFIRREYAPVAINYITQVQEHHMKFYMTVVGIVNDVWGVARNSGVLKHLLTIQYKDLLVHPVSAMFHLICPVIPLYNLWSAFLGVEFTNMCIQNVCSCCYRSVNVSVPLLLPQCLCLQCFEMWTQSSEETVQSVVNVLCSSPSFGPPMTEIHVKNWREEMEFVASPKRFPRIAHEKHQYFSFVELIFAMRRMSVGFRDDRVDDNTKVVCLVMNPDGTVSSQTVRHQMVAKGVLNLFKEDARVLSMCLSYLQLPYRDQRVSVAVELSQGGDTNAWAQAIGQLYNRIPAGWAAVGPAYIFQECSPSANFKGFVDIFAQTAQAAVWHARPCTQTHVSSMEPSWCLRRTDKKRNEHSVVYTL